MNTELMDRGLKDTKLVVNRIENDKVTGVAQQFEGEPLKELMQALDEVENSLQILERRGLNLGQFLKKEAEKKGLPTFRVLLGGREHWFANAEEVDAFRREHGQDLEVADDPQAAGGPSNGHGERLFVQELHEVRGINRGLDRLRKFSITGADLVPLPRIAGREPPQRFFLETGDHQRPLLHLRGLVGEIRKLGEKGLTITRFKGLGEMDPEELWETTLDPAKRTLLRVHLEDAFKADEMFRTLMGEKVEPRRDFIQKHALEVKDIDYHGA